MGDGQSPQSDSNSPSQSQAKGGQKEETPDGPQEQKGDEGKEGEQGEKPKPAEGQPQGAQADPPPTPNQGAGGPPTNPTQDPLQVGRSREQWGNLPIHMQELFRAEGGDHVPARYRDWIDNYYRRLNDRGGRR
jgi:hypothetical protein